MAHSPVDSDTWIRRFQSAPDAGVRLVCFPHAGGAASFYFPVAKALQPKVEVLAVQYPGRQDRRAEPPFTDIRPLADGAYAALRPWLTDRTVFFGHSMGAVVAFEVALRMERDGVAAPAALVASGRRAPSRRRPESVHRRDDEGIVRELKKLNGTENTLLDDEEVLQMFLPALRGDYQAIETYDCPPDARVSCPVTVFVGDHDPQVTMEEAGAWRDHTSAGFELQVFKGGHFYLSARPGETLARLGAVIETQAAGQV